VWQQFFSLREYIMTTIKFKILDTDHGKVTIEYSSPSDEFRNFALVFDAYNIDYSDPLSWFADQGVKSIAGLQAAKKTAEENAELITSLKDTEHTISVTQEEIGEPPIVESDEELARRVILKVLEELGITK